MFGLICSVRSCVCFCIIQAQLRATYYFLPKPSETGGIDFSRYYTFTVMKMAYLSNLGINVQNYNRPDIQLQLKGKFVDFEQRQQEKFKDFEQSEKNQNIIKPHAHLIFELRSLGDIRLDDIRSFNYSLEDTLAFIYPLINMILGLNTTLPDFSDRFNKILDLAGIEK